MQPTHKQLVKDLLAGMYLMKVKSHTGKVVYKLYRGNMDPVRYVRLKPVQRSVLSDLLKVDKRDRLTLNLSKVRQLNGNNWIKQYYKSQIVTNGKK